MNTLIKKTLAVTTAMMLCLPNFSISATEQADNIRNMKEYVLGMNSNQTSAVNVYSILSHKKTVLSNQQTENETAEITVDKEITADSPISLDISQYKGMGRLVSISLDVEATYKEDVLKPMVSGEIGFTLDDAEKNNWGQVFYTAEGQAGQTKITTVDTAVPEEYQNKIAYDILRITRSWSNGTDIKIKKVRLVFDKTPAQTTIDTSVSTSETTITTVPTETTLPETTTTIETTTNTTVTSATTQQTEYGNTAEITVDREITYENPINLDISAYKGKGRLVSIGLDVEATYKEDVLKPMVSGEIGFTLDYAEKNNWGQVFYVAEGQAGQTKITTVDTAVPEEYQTKIAYDLLRITRSWSNGTDIKIKKVRLVFDNTPLQTTTTTVSETTPATTTPQPTTTTVTTTPQVTTTTPKVTTVTTTTTPKVTTTPTTTTTPKATTVTTTSTTPVSALIRNVKNVEQMPELPTGCEAAGLTIALNFYGYNVSKTDVAMKYMPRMNFYYQNGVRYGADFRTTFAGDPSRSDGYGCYAPCLVATANRYFAAVGSSAQGVDISGTPLKELFRYVAKGTPVVLISTPNLVTPYLSSSWYTPSGEYVTWQANHHCLVLIGYDYNKGTVTCANPGTRYSPSTYNISDFERIYNLKGKSAMIISTTGGTYIPNVNPINLVVGDRVRYSGTVYETSYGTGNTINVNENVYKITNIIEDNTRKYNVLINSLGWVASDAVTEVQYGATTGGKLNGKTFRLRNVGSGKYINVHLGYDNNETNVYQWTGDGSKEQMFRMTYKSSNDTYQIGAVSSSTGKVLDIVKVNGAVVSGANVEIYSAVDAIAQEWKFIELSDGVYKIVPNANQGVAITANGTANGTAGGTASTSAGNVYISTYTGSDNQKWYLEKVE